jgi:hypothetical protein
LERGAPLQQDQQIAPAAIAQPIIPQLPRANANIVSIFLKNIKFYFLL